MSVTKLSALMLLVLVLCFQDALAIAPTKGIAPSKGPATTTKPPKPSPKAPKTTRRKLIITTTAFVNLEKEEGASTTVPLGTEQPDESTISVTTTKTTTTTTQEPTTTTPQTTTKPNIVNPSPSTTTAVEGTAALTTTTDAPTTTAASQLSNAIALSFRGIATVSVRQKVVDLLTKFLLLQGFSEEDFIIRFVLRELRRNRREEGFDVIIDFKESVEVKKASDAEVALEDPTFYTDVEDEENIKFIEAKFVQPATTKASSKTSNGPSTTKPTSNPTETPSTTDADGTILESEDDDNDNKRQAIIIGSVVAAVFLLALFVVAIQESNKQSAQKKQIQKVAPSAIEISNSVNSKQNVSEHYYPKETSASGVKVPTVFENPGYEGNITGEPENPPVYEDAEGSVVYEEGALPLENASKTMM
eukprot:m.331580 g.331580  ORF g.331580 m.331580 type:complete len:418 (+) comp16755_c0_seq1:208-1461(+)